MGSFQVQNRGAALIVRCPAWIDRKAAGEFMELCPAWNENPPPLLVLDLSDTQEMDPGFVRTVVQLAQTLKKGGGQLASANAGREVLTEIKNGGLVASFGLKDSVSQALAGAGLPTRPTIDVTFVNPFITATANTLRIQANTEIRIGKPYLKSAETKLDADIAGVLSLTSNSFNGSIALCFPKRVFLGIYGAMTGESPADITPEIEDAAGELLNIIFGQAKVELNQAGNHQIQKAIPAVVRGKELSVRHLSRSAAIILPFEASAGPFHLEMSLDPT
jgi:chemotaxis protein CheX